jgi:hypothetical protein
MKSKWVEYKGKRILHIDLSNFYNDMLGFDAELTETVATLGQDIYKMPEHSALVLVDLTNTRMTQEANKLLSERVTDTKKYVLKTAVVGMTGIRKVFLDYFARLASSETGSFDNLEEAKRWLVK